MFFQAVLLPQLITCFISLCLIVSFSTIFFQKGNYHANAKIIVSLQLCFVSIFCIEYFVAVVSYIPVFPLISSFIEQTFPECSQHSKQSLYSGGYDRKLYYFLLFAFYQSGWDELYSGSFYNNWENFSNYKIIKKKYHSQKDHKNSYSNHKKLIIGYSTRKDPN